MHSAAFVFLSAVGPDPLPHEQGPEQNVCGVLYPTEALTSPNSSRESCATWQHNGTTQMYPCHSNSMPYSLS